MIIEFFGLPGSGKSHIAKIIQKRFIKDGIPAQLTNEQYFQTHSKFGWRLKKITSILRLLVSRPSSFKIIKVIIGEAGPIKKKILRIYNVLGVTASNIVFTKEGVTLRDEGIFQILFSLCVLDIDDHQKYCSLFKKFIVLPDVVVHLKSSVSISQSLSEQGRGGQLEKYLEDGSLTESFIYKIEKDIILLIEEEISHIIRLNNDKSDHSLEEIIDTIMQSISLKSK